MINGESLPVLIVVGLLVAFACWALLYGLVVLVSGRRAIVRERMRQFVTEGGQPEGDTVDRRRQLRENLFNQIDSRWRERSISRQLFGPILHDMEKADLKMTLTEMVLILVALSGGLAAVLWLVAPAYGPILALLGFVLAFLILRTQLRALGRRRVRRFEDQLPDTLSILASSVRGGFSLFQAMQLISEEAAEPSKTEFLRVIHEIALGSAMDDALGGLARRMPTEDVEILVTAISLQQQTGGSLSHVLDVVANTVRERHRVQRDIAALTAQQRFSAILLAALPYLLALVVFVISPLYMSHLFQWGWVLCMPVGAFIFSVIGLIIMRRIASIDV